MAHSYGGASAVRLALRSPELLREVGDPLFEEYRALVEDFLRLARVSDGAAAWQRFLDYRNGPGSWAALDANAQARLVSQVAIGVASFEANLANPTSLADCARLAAWPTTIVHGAATTAPDRRVAEVLHASVPDSRLETIEGAGHMSPITHPAALAAILRAHFRRVGGA